MRRVERGALNVARRLLSISRRPPLAVRPAVVNGQAGLVVRDADGVLQPTDWDTALTKVRGTINTVGLYTMGRKERKVAREYRRLVEEYSHLPISSSKFPILTA